MGLGVRWAGMVFGRLVWSVGVMAVVIGMGGLWGPGRDCHEMNHVSERPLLVVFEVPNYMLNDLISFFFVLLPWGPIHPTFSTF